ncbi:putative c-5 cytosine-specific DNA methylase [Mycobacterium xenopi 3993]|nr:putative c-5 cytosine-specific DNA methylase [Mycobacterium xenopi 3993]
MAVRIASNHWDLAVETHNTNHPDADHLCADLSAVDPRRFRAPTCWASPECTNHSVAGPQARRRATDLFGEVLPDAAAERSRATMWDVPRFAEAHRYQAVIVENVVDAWHWSRPGVADGDGQPRLRPPRGVLELDARAGVRPAPAVAGPHVRGVLAERQPAAGD